MQQNDFLTDIKKKKFYKKFFYGLKKSPFCSLIELYDNEYRINFTKPTKIYYNILSYCDEKWLMCNGEKITLSNGEERFKITITFKLV
jgi:hypothetical protein